MFPALIVAAALLMQAGPGTENPQQQRPIGTRGLTDQTVNVTKGMRLVLDECTGDAIITTWDRDAVRVRAEHSRSAKVQITPRDQVLRISRDGGMSSVDYELSVPAWIAVSIEGTYCTVDVKGLAGNLTAKSSEGDIILRDITGSATVESIEGTIKIEGGRGRIQATTSDGDIEVTKAAGELELTSIDGDIRVTDAMASALEMSTIDGDLIYSGSFQPNGRYRFETHDGDVWLVLPETTSATFVLRRYDSSRKLDSTLPLKTSTENQRGRRITATLGGGSAQVDIETFDGDVHFRKTGEAIKKQD
jgi:DUF4097 and DUF4098 domain-containing protein YvlB